MSYREINEWLQYIFTQLHSRWLCPPHPEDVVNKMLDSIRWNIHRWFKMKIPHLDIVSLPMAKAWWQKMDGYNESDWCRQHIAYTDIDLTHDSQSTDKKWSDLPEVVCLAGGASGLSYRKRHEDSSLIKKIQKEDHGWDNYRCWTLKTDHHTAWAPHCQPGMGLRLPPSANAPNWQHLTPKTGPLMSPRLSNRVTFGHKAANKLSWKDEESPKPHQAIIYIVV